MGGDDLLRQAVDELDDVVYVYDDAVRLVYWNDRLNDLFDLTDEELCGMTPTDFFLEPDREGVERAVAEVFEHGETVVEARGDTTEGVVHFQLSAHLLTDDGTVLGFAGVGRDVTEAREQAVKLAAQNERLSEFARLLAHDVRNPLTVAHAGLDLYESGGDAEHLERARTSLGRIEGIIDDVLTVAADGRAVTDPEPVALAAVVRDAWEMVATAEAALDVRTDATVEADSARLGRLFENLFRNAVEHAGRACTVTVTDTPVGFAVCDDGPGIDPADRDTVFEPGFSGTADGTGLGLYVVETIASAHGWTVSVADGDAPDADDVSDVSAGLEPWSETTAPGACFEFTLFPGGSERAESTPP
jgi:PAS domain S-box-containing protein